MPTNGTEDATRPIDESVDLVATQSQQLELIYHLARQKYGLGTDLFDPTSALIEAHDLERASQPPAAVFEKQRAGMRIGELLMLYALQEALANSADAQAAFARGPATKLLLAATLPARAWIGSFESAAVAVVGDIVRRRGMVTEGVAFSRINHRFGYPELDARAVDNMRRGHLIILCKRDEAMPELAAEMLDASVVVEITPTALLAALTDAGVPNVASAIPDVADVAILGPETVDMIVDRFGPAESVASAIGRAAEVVRRRPSEAATPTAQAGSERPKPGRYGIMPTELLRPTSPRVEDLSGYGRAAEWAQDLALDVADYRAGRVAWADVDGGCLLFGPPGTGKTTFARAVAASCDLPLVATSYTDWQSQGEAHGGTLVKAMKQRFNDALDNAPCIIFIDEIDAFPARGSAGSNEGWWRPITTSLLECLDGSVRRDGVVVLAACNDPSNLDPALVRSGRLDRRFEIGLPDEAALRGIIGWHMPDAGEDVIDPVATVLAGSASGADVARFAREARRLARRDRREVTGADLLAVAMPLDTRSTELRWQIAVHEAGHALAVMAQGRIPGSLSLVESAIAHGMVDTNPGEFLGRIEDVDARVVVILAGRAAEEVVLGRITAGASTDLQRATEIVADALARWGLGTRLRASGTISGEAVETHLRRLYVEATEVIGQHREAVEALARLALERRILGRAALTAFAAEHGFAGVQS